MASSSALGASLKTYLRSATGALTLVGRASAMVGIFASLTALAASTMHGAAGAGDQGPDRRVGGQRGDVGGRGGGVGAVVADDQRELPVTQQPVLVDLVDPSCRAWA